MNELKDFLHYYVPADDTLFRLVEMPEGLYDVIEEGTGIMPGMEFPVHSFCERGVRVRAEDVPLMEEFDGEIFLSWPAIEPVDAEERNLFRMAMTNYAEYNKWLEVAVTPSWAN